VSLDAYATARQAYDLRQEPERELDLPGFGTDEESKYLEREAAREFEAIWDKSARASAR